MPSCYLLAVCSGSSLDQQSNNVTLFNLVEQLNLRPGAEPPRGLIPLEIHAYFELAPEEVGFEFEIRFCMVAETGLETEGAIVRDGSNDGLEINLETTNPTLAISSNELGVKYSTTAGGLDQDATGLKVKVDGTTISINGSGQIFLF